MTAVIKDLIRYLKRDDETHTIRRFLGQTKLLQTDLVRIFIHHVNNTELWDILLRYVLISMLKQKHFDCIKDYMTHILDVDIIKCYFSFF